jgi:putative aldouronate transport system permease protein
MTVGLHPRTALPRGNRLRLIRKQMRNNWDVYLMVLPGLLLLLMFRYLPMYGVIVAFKNYNVVRGILGSDWIGFENFQRLTYSFEFKRAFRNTLLLSTIKMVFGMPVPIIFALLLNELRNIVYKRITQTIVYIPHFISWVVVGGIFMDLLSPSTGIVNKLIESLGGKAIFFMASPRWARTLMVVTDIWKEFGWGTIIYLAAITGVDPELYSAAAIDGAGRLRQIIHVTLPAISNTFVILLVMRLGNIMSGANFEQVFVMYTPAIYEQVDILGTYTYRTAFDTLDFGYTSAVGLFQSVIGCVLLVSSNAFAKRMGGRGMY